MNRVTINSKKVAQSKSKVYENKGRISKDFFKALINCKYIKNVHFYFK